MKLPRPVKDGHSKPSARYGYKGRHELLEITIGKDMLELISSAMYVDPMTIYREYIQNAADALDVARATGVLSVSEPGRVDISLDVATRTVNIRDNGCGLPFQDFEHTLTALGASKKRGLAMRGFRGIGRLAGLAYAQELVFRSRCIGEVEISVLRWDCRQIKAMLRDESDTLDVADLIRKVTNLERIKCTGFPEHFFEVEMRSVVRLRNDRLISTLAITEYICQVAPVPFSPEFKFGTKISQVLSSHMDLGELEIRINKADEPIYRPHRNSMEFSEKSILNFDNLSFVEIPSVDENIAAVAWVLHHEYEGSLPTGTLVKGLRLRTGNIQIGGHILLEDLFPEPRFNSWSVGEVHVFDRRIVPNGCRDQFQQNIHFYNLINHLTPTARDIARRCRTNSVRRKHEREFELCEQTAAEMIDIINQGSSGRLRQEQLALAMEQTLLRMRRTAGHKVLTDIAADLEKRINMLHHQLREAMNDGVVVSSLLMRLPEEKRKSYQQFFDLVYECSANRSSAKALIDRILLKLK